MHGVRSAREARAWSQLDLARAAGVPRATISAIETGRVSPSVQVAIQLSRALDRAVEDLFSPSPPNLGWAWPPPEGVVRFWAAQVGAQSWAYPVEPFGAAPAAPDGIARQWTQLPVPPLDRLRATLVLATCDPTVGLLAEPLAARGVRLIALNRPSGAALQLLRQGLVHAAGVHLARPDQPEDNRAAAPADVDWMPGARWEVGVLLAPELRRRALIDVVRRDVRWVNRPAGSGARACLDRVLQAHRGDRPAPEGYEREARDHFAVAEVVASGFAQAGVALPMVAQARGLDFRLVETALYEICVPKAFTSDPRLRALREVLESRSFRAALSQVPGMAPVDAVP